MSNKMKNMDRISLLPDCLLHHILTSLNTKQVVQTCVLSKRWKTVWTCVPTLNFDFCSYTFKGSTENSVLKVRSFNLFAVRVLSKLSGSHIIKLSYSAHHHEDHILEGMLCYAQSRMVKELWIDSYNDLADIDWIGRLSACKSLNVLKITCMFFAEWGTLMLPSLSTLEICNANADCELFENKQMFSGCPNLLSLVLVDADWVGCATIYAPKLENLELCCTASHLFFAIKEVELFTPSLRCVKFENVLPIMKSSLDFPCLDKVNIVADFGDDFINEYGQPIVYFPRAFHNARSITMSINVMQALLAVPTANLLFHNLRHLKLKASKTKKKIDFSMNKLQYLLNCPTLETMVLDLN